MAETALAQKMDELQALMAGADDQKVQMASRLIGCEELLRRVDARLEVFEANVSGFGPHMKGLQAKIDVRLDALERKVLGRLEALAAQMGPLPGGCTLPPTSAGQLPSADAWTSSAMDAVARSASCMTEAAPEAAAAALVAADLEASQVASPVLQPAASVSPPPIVTVDTTRPILTTDLSRLTAGDRVPMILAESPRVPSSAVSASSGLRSPATSVVAALDAAGGAAAASVAQQLEDALMHTRATGANKAACFGSVGFDLEALQPPMASSPGKAAGLAEEGLFGAPAADEGVSVATFVAPASPPKLLPASGPGPAQAQTAAVATTASCAEGPSWRSSGTSSLAAWSLNETATILPGSFSDAAPMTAPLGSGMVSVAAPSGTPLMSNGAGVQGNPWSAPAPSIPESSKGTVVSQKTTLLSASSAITASPPTSAMSSTSTARGRPAAAPGAAPLGTSSLRVVTQYLQAESQETAAAFERACSELPLAPPLLGSRVMFGTSQAIAPPTVATAKN